MQNKLQNRISWLDYGKGISMLVIILFHIDLYYVGEASLLANLLLYHTSIAFFFFTSGYVTKIEEFDFKNSISYIVKRLLIPYFIFTTIIYFPKHLLHGMEIDSFSILYDIFGGIASWFVAALVVSRLALSIILKFTKSIPIIGICCLILSVVGFIMTQYLEAPVPWYANYGLMSMIYSYLGIVFRKYESVLKDKIKFQVILSTSLYLILVLIDLYLLKESQWHYICSSSYIFGLETGQVVLLRVIYHLITSFLGIWMMILLLKLMPANVKILSYIGRNSLTYYFLNGGVIFTITVVLHKLGFPYNGNYFWALLFFIFVVLILTISSELINRFAPWMIGDFKKKDKL